MSEIWPLLVLFLLPQVLVFMTFWLAGLPPFEKPWIKSLPNHEATAVTQAEKSSAIAHWHC
jgi:hypothetical protein